MGELSVTPVPLKPVAVMVGNVDEATPESASVAAFAIVKVMS